MSNVCFVILTLVIFTGFALGESTEEMLSSCKAVSEAKVSDTTAAFPKNFESGECWGALSALQYLSRTRETIPSYGTRTSSRSR